MTSGLKDETARQQAAVWRARARREQDCGRPAREAAALRRALRFEPDQISARLRYGQLLLRFRKLPQALDQAQEACRLDPDSDDAIRLYGTLLCCRRRFRDAARQFADWTDRQPQEPDAWFRLARARLLSGDRAGGREACAHLLEIDPGFLRGHLLMARIALSNDNFKLRLIHLKAAVDLLPKAVALRLKLIEAMLRRLQIKGAMTVAQEAQAIAPEDVAVLLMLARCHIALGQINKAQALLDGIDPGQADPAELSRVREDLGARSNRVLPGSVSETKPAVTAPVATDEKPKEPVPAPAAVRSESVKPFVRPAPLRTAPAAAANGPRRSDRFDEPWHGTILEANARPIGRPGLIDHILIIRALILRDLRLRYQDSRIGATVELIRPVAVVVAHYYMFWLIHKPMPGQIPIQVYVLAGFASWFAFSTTAIGAGSGGKWPGGANLLPGITKVHLRVAKAIWPLLLNLVFCLGAFIPLNIYGSRLPLPAIPLTVLIFCIAGGIGFGFGILTERLATVWPLIKTVEKLLSWGLYVTSGLYFSLATMPPVLAAWFWYNPLLHLVEYERHAFDPGYPISMLDLRYPTLVMLGLLGSGLVALKCLSQPAQD